MHDFLSRHGILHFAPLNEAAMMILKIFKVPSQTCCKIINYLKKMGLTPGIPDLIILRNGTVYFLELKDEAGKISEKQNIIHAALVRAGYEVATVYNFDQAVNKLKEWGIVT
jgi:hypothetical protein